MQPLRNCNGPTIRIGREILCLPYAGFLLLKHPLVEIEGGGAIKRRQLAKLYIYRNFFNYCSYSWEETHASQGVLLCGKF